MGKFFLIFTQLFLIILSSTTYAEDYCEDFFDQISKFDTKYEIESNSINQFFSPSGITLGLVYNSKDSWKHLTIDGYPIIKSLLPDTSAYSVLEPNDIILEVDGIDIRNDPTSFRFIEAWNYEINQDIDLLIKRNNGEKEELKLTPKEALIV
jgi:C-terminal processing protease CtpA/Prc